MIILAGIVAMALAAATYATTSQPAGNPAVAAFVEQLAQKLTLTAEQQEKVLKIAEDAKTAIAADPASQRQLVLDMWAKINGELTAAQQETLRQVQAGGGERPAGADGGAKPATSAPAAASYNDAPTAKKLTPFKPFNEANEPAWFDYVRRPDPAFKYTVQTTADSGGTDYQIDMTSQVWQGQEWKSPMAVFIPAKSIAPDTALLAIGGGQGSAAQNQSAMMGFACATVGGYADPVFGMPWNKAMLYAVQQCLEHGDPNWAILCPYVKAAVRAMDVVQAVSAKQGTPIKKFILTGHSRCGYTSYALATFDPRVIGIAPCAGHILGYEQQLKIGAVYISAMLQPGQAASEAGLQYLAMTDPYLQRAKMTMPKLDICGTNDEMFPPKTLGAFWDGLPGPKYLLAVDNAIHAGGPTSVQASPKTRAAIVAFARATATGKALPAIEAKFSEIDGAIHVELTTSVAGKSAKLWTASSPTNMDSCKWTPQPMDIQDGGKAFTATGPKAAAAMQGAYGEVEYEQDGLTYWLTTEFKIVKH